MTLIELLLFVLGILLSVLDVVFNCASGLLGPRNIPECYCWHNKGQEQRQRLPSVFAKHSPLVIGLADNFPVCGALFHEA